MLAFSGLLGRFAPWIALVVAVSFGLGYWQIDRLKTDNGALRDSKRKLELGLANAELNQKVLEIEIEQSAEDLRRVSSLHRSGLLQMAKMQEEVLLHRQQAEKLRQEIENAKKSDPSFKRWADQLHGPVVNSLLNGAKLRPSSESDPR